MSDLSRRSFLPSLPLAATLGATGRVAGAAKPRQFRIWVSGCSHVGADLRRKRESLAEAIRHSESDFDWDVALHLGDFSSTQTAPDDKEGEEVIRQFQVLKKHGRNDFYCVAGNHDASGPGGKTMAWFRKWIDPTGENTKFSTVDNSQRKYPVEGTWERYAFRAGNLLFLMMSDRNDGGPPVGRAERGGYPAGAVTSQTFEWWRENVENNRDAVIVSCHHHMLKATTVASGPGEAFTKIENGKPKVYHGKFERGAPQGAGYLYWLDDRPDAQAFEKYLEKHPGSIDFWLGAHTHAHPDDMHENRTLVERKWDVTFCNCAALTKYHGRTSVPMSRLLTFTEGSDQVSIQCYLHTNHPAPQGWYQPAERTASIGKAFRFES